MILHVVLFTPRPDVTDSERAAFAGSLEHALGVIPVVRAFRVGRRVRTGAAYDALPGEFEFFAMLEFDDEAGLRAYQQHAAHQELGRLFYATSRHAFAADFDAVDRAPAAALAAWQAAPEG